MKRVVLSVFSKYFYLLIFVMIFIVNVDISLTSAGHFPEPAISPQVCDFLGTILINNMPAKPDDEIAFFDSSGQLCGLFIVKQTGQYGFLHVYGDDSASQTDEGAITGETLFVRVWNSQTGIEYQGDNISLISGTQMGSVLPSVVPPQWQANSRYVLNIHAYLKGDINGNGIIELSDAIQMMKKLSQLNSCDNCTITQDINTVIHVLKTISNRYLNYFR
ncbi:hypothetical protein MHK_003765 [Candidatus Magnetomorum sp. HK-1]|nr:hypothetical protein MHK_003765 [Candidatus Magnetomorum sp. HK-1]